MQLIAPIKQFMKSVESTGMKVDSKAMEFLQGMLMSELPEDGSLSAQHWLSQFVSRNGGGNPALAYVQVRANKAMSEVKDTHRLAMMADSSLRVASEQLNTPMKSWAEASPELKSMIVSIKGALQGLETVAQSLPIKLSREVGKAVQNLSTKLDDMTYLGHALQMAEYEASPEQVIARTRVAGMGR